MASFTIEFKKALEADPSIEEDVLAKYPLYDEGYRPWLNQQIKDQFWNREIGMESISMFKLALKRKLNQIMPIYNEQYKITVMAAGLDPLQTVRVENSSESEGNTSSTAGSENESESEARARAIGSDFPQTMIADNGDFASNGQDNTSRTTAKGSADETSETKQAGKNKGVMTGSQGQQSMLLLQHRQTLVNVDLMVLNELEELFFGLWSNGDSFTQNKTTGILGYGNGQFGYGFFGI